MEKNESMNLEFSQEELERFNKAEKIADTIAECVSGILNASGLTLPQCVTAIGMAFQDLLLISFEQLQFDVERSETALDLLFGDIKKHMVEYIKECQDEDSK